MRLPVLLLCTILTASSEEGPPASMQFAKRMISTLPELPEVIAGGLEGRSDGIKSMLSTVLGDGLISQLVVNPMGVAEEVLPDLGINKTTFQTADQKNTSANLSNSLFGRNNGLLSFFTTTQKTTTPEVMLVDGVPVKDFDEYIRRHNLEGTFTTKKPPAPTTRPPTPEEFADIIASRIKPQAPSYPMPPSSLHADDMANSFDLGMIDPRRLGEVNSLLRRAPQRFDTMGSPPGFMQAEPPASSLDPAINEVVTNLRVKGADGLSTEDIKRLKNILETYEAALQTKEFISKRNQLQVLQVELEEQKKRIELQRKMETELRTKAKEIETKKAKMEAQLREQLQSWNLTHLIDMQDAPPSIKSLMDLPDLKPPMYPQLVDSGISAAPPSPPPEMSPMEEITTEEDITETTTETTSMPEPPSTIPAISTRYHSRDFGRRQQSEIRFSPSRVRVPLSTSIRRDDENPSPCDCIEIETNQLSGKWVPALASKSMLNEAYSQLNSFLEINPASDVTCSRIQISPFKRVRAGAEARLTWEYKTTDDDGIRRMQGSAIKRNDNTMEVNIRDGDGSTLSAPMCVVRTDEENTYMLLVNSEGPCNQAALIVRDPEEFFSLDNIELVDYLKKKKQSSELDELEMIPFAKDCE